MARPEPTMRLTLTYEYYGKVLDDFVPNVPKVILPTIATSTQAGVVPPAPDDKGTWYVDWEFPFESKVTGKVEMFAAPDGYNPVSFFSHLKTAYRSENAQVQDFAVPMDAPSTPARLAPRQRRSRCIHASGARDVPSTPVALPQAEGTSGDSSQPPPAEARAASPKGRPKWADPWGGPPPVTPEGPGEVEEDADEAHTPPGRLSFPDSLDSEDDQSLNWDEEAEEAGAAVNEEAEEAVPASANTFNPPVYHPGPVPYDPATLFADPSSGEYFQLVPVCTDPPPMIVPYVEATAFSGIGGEPEAGHATSRPHRHQAFATTDPRIWHGSTHSLGGAYGRLNTFEEVVRTMPGLKAVGGPSRKRPTALEVTEDADAAGPDAGSQKNKAAEPKVPDALASDDDTIPLLATEGHVNRSPSSRDAVSEFGDETAIPPKTRRDATPHSNDQHRRAQPNQSPSQVPSGMAFTATPDPEFTIGVSMFVPDSVIGKEWWNHPERLLGASTRPVFLLNSKPPKNPRLHPWHPIEVVQALDRLRVTSKFIQYDGEAALVWVLIHKDHFAVEEQDEFLTMVGDALVIEHGLPAYFDERVELALKRLFFFFECRAKGVFERRRAKEAAQGRADQRRRLAFEIAASDGFGMRDEPWMPSLALPVQAGRAHLTSKKRPRDSDEVDKESASSLLHKRPKHATQVEPVSEAVGPSRWKGKKRARDEDEEGDSPTFAQKKAKTL